MTGWKKGEETKLIVDGHSNGVNGMTVVYVSAMVLLEAEDPRRISHLDVTNDPYLMPAFG